MEYWQDLWQQLRMSIMEPARFFVDPNERVFVLYLGSGLLCALIVYVIARRRNPAGTSTGLLAYLFPRHIYLHPSAKADYKFFLIDRVLSFLVLPFFTIVSSLIAEPTLKLLQALFGPVEVAILPPGILTTLLMTLAATLVIDLALWWIHYLHHRVPVLWEFHKVHHSAEVMTPITAYRMHPVEIILNFNLTNIVIGINFAIFQYLTAGSVVIYQVVGLNIFFFLFYLVGFNLRHSHIPMAYPRLVSYLLVSPWMHQVHHSQERRHIDKNMGFIFSFWDGLFGTLYIPARDEKFAIGLDSGEAPEFHHVGALYLRPFRNILARFRVPSVAKPTHKSS